MIGLDSIQPTYAPPSLDTIADNEQDVPVTGAPLVTISSGMPPLVFGGGALSGLYNVDDHLRSDGPLRAVRLALRYGITAFDTSPYYGASELVLGGVLTSLAPEFPRSSYKLMTKCGRYGPEEKDFDYSPDTIRRSITRSLNRLGTTYLDFVCLHDVEFVASPVHPKDPTGDPTVVLASKEKKEQWGLLEENIGIVHGDGDEKILAALGELRKLKAEGLVKAIGITGYPLPTLIRLALLARKHFDNEPLDIILSYSHYTLQNATLSEFLPYFTLNAGIPQLLSASPLSMGLFTPSPPWWHPAPPGLFEAKLRAAEVCQEVGWEGGLPNIANGFSMRRKGLGEAWERIPTVVGLSSIKEVHDTVKAWREVNSDLEVESGPRRLELEEQVKEIFKEGGWVGWSWAQPPL